MKKVGVIKEEKQLSYYRFFEQELAPVPQEKLEILKQGPSKTEMVSFEEKDLFLKGEDDDYLPDRIWCDERWHRFCM